MSVIECPHGVDDGCCKECYEQSTSPLQRQAEPLSDGDTLSPPEPVAWMDIAEDGTRLAVRMFSDGSSDEVPLYTRSN